MTTLDDEAICATVSADAAASTEWDVAVLGAGPAGSTAALVCARKGARVLLVDKMRFPRPKVCGCCISRAALDVLDTLGLTEVVTDGADNELRSVRLAAGGRQATMPLAGGVAMSRASFDAALVKQAIAAGAAFLPECSATLGEAAVESRCVQLRHGSDNYDIRARMIVVATGLRTGSADAEPHIAALPTDDACIGAGTVLPAQHCPRLYEPGVIYMACGNNAYVGLVRLEDGSLDVAAAFHPQVVRQQGGCGEAAAQVLRAAGLPPVDSLQSTRWQGTPKLTRRPKRVAAQRVVVVGDAAGYVEPFTGEGIAWALASGAAVAGVVRESLQSARWSEAMEQRWQREHRRLLRASQMRCRLVTILVRRPRLMSAAVMALSAVPVLHRPAVHLATRVGASIGRPEGSSVSL